jgi:hypothetical protein
MPDFEFDDPFNSAFGDAVDPITGNPYPAAGIDDPTIDQSAIDKTEFELGALDPEDPARADLEEQLEQEETSENTLSDDEEHDLQADEFAGLDEAVGEQELKRMRDEELDNPADDVMGQPATTILPGQDAKVKTTPNSLSSYASSTYILTLRALTPADYNRLAEDPLASDSTQSHKPLRPKVIIASAGRKSQDLPRNIHFTEDFYFENLKFTTVVGMNARSRAANVIELSFRIVEPYGFTFHNRLVKLAEDTGIQSIVEQPYLLTIDFFGWGDDGSWSQQQDQTKNIPIKITAMKAKVSQRGGEYDCQAIPYNHAAFQDTNVTTPVNLGVNADTVYKFFDDAVSTNLAAEQDQRESEVKEADKAASTGAYRTPEGKAEAEKNAQNKAAKLKSPYYVSTFAGAINDWFRDLVKKGNCQHPMKISFDIDKPIGDSKIVFPKKNNPKNTPMANPQDPAQAKELARTNAGQKGSGPVNITEETFPIPAGTNIIEVINMVVRNSDYIRSQLTDPSQEKYDPQTIADQQAKPLNWFRVIPTVKLINFDYKTNKWAKAITFHVKQFTFYNQRNPYAPKGQPEGWVKEYNYIYTGKNKDVIDFDIDFDMLFYTALTAQKAKMESLSGAAEADESKLASAMPTANTKTGSPVVYNFVPGDIHSTSLGDGNRDSQTITATDVVKNIYSSARGDMINIKMKIIGDPELIKQDDVFYNPSNAGYDEDRNQFTQNQSIKFDRGEVHAKITFNTPVDIDEATGGIAYFAGDKVQSTFSGLYKFTTVENEFQRGEFTQTLSLIRLPNQPAFDNVGPLAGSASEGTNSKINRQESDTGSTRGLKGSGDLTELSGELDSYPEDDNTDIDTTEDEDNTAVTDEEDTELDDTSEADQEDETGDEFDNTEDAELQDVGDNADTMDISEAQDEEGNETIELSSPSPAVENIVDEAEAMAQREADLRAQYPQQAAFADKLAADLDSPDPRVKKAAAKTMIESVGKGAVQIAEATVTLTEGFIKAIKKGLASKEFQTKATDQEKETAKAFLAEMEANLPGYRETAKKVKADYAKGLAEAKRDGLI